MQVSRSNPLLQHRSYAPPFQSISKCGTCGRQNEWARQIPKTLRFPLRQGGVGEGWRLVGSALDQSVDANPIATTAIKNLFRAERTTAGTFHVERETGDAGLAQDVHEFNHSAVLGCLVGADDGRVFTGFGLPSRETLTERHPI